MKAHLVKVCLSNSIQINTRAAIAGQKCEPMIEMVPFNFTTEVLTTPFPLFLIDIANIYSVFPVVQALFRALYSKH